MIAIGSLIGFTLVNFGLAARIQDAPNRADKLYARESDLETNVARLQKIWGEDGLAGCTRDNSLYVSMKSLKIDDFMCKGIIDCTIYSKNHKVFVKYFV